MNDLKAQILLMKCKGDEIWSLDACKAQGVPDSWIEELADTFESGFDNDQNRIYVDEKLTNQYHGVHDLSLAYKLAEYLGIDWKSATQFAIGRTHQVKAIQEAFEEL